MRCTAFLLLLAAPLSAHAAGQLPDAASLGRAVFSGFDAASTRSGEQVVACGQKGDGIARFVEVKPWKAKGRDQFVAAFGIWVIDPETNEPLEFAMACGRPACEVALLDRDGAALRLVARGRVEAGCLSLDLAPYVMAPGETLIGVRGDWMNHGFGDTTLTLLKIEGSALRTVLAVPVDVSTPDYEETGVVSMVPRPGGPADLHVRYQREGVPDAQGQVHPGPTRTERFRWTGKSYKLVARP